MTSSEKLGKNKTKDEAWYLLQVYPGREEIIKSNIEESLDAEKLRHWVSQIVIPKNEASNYNERNLFSGWLILKMQMDMNAWKIIRNMPGVIGFVGLGNTPTPFHYQDWKQLPFSRFSN